MRRFLYLKVDHSQKYSSFPNCFAVVKIYSDVQTGEVPLLKFQSVNPWKSLTNSTEGIVLKCFMFWQRREGVRGNTFFLKKFQISIPFAKANPGKGLVRSGFYGGLWAKLRFLYSSSFF